MRTKPSTLPTPRIAIRGEFGVDVADLVTMKLERVARHAHRPILDVHVRLTRDEHAAGNPPVTVEVNLDLNGRQVRAETGARSARDALDRVVDRLVRQLDDQPVPHRGRRAARR
ncbi:MAG TPA: HPF/RaiA family ribosome-associated protein [Actinophytocola sp.]|jgi:ribosomal subunit interface protein|uniref:HPF/RaiA family ribosome-associated protein n=1 Tax=Actinophytocola sp. TaxID=1872138 RepID=UPI002F92770B